MSHQVYARKWRPKSLDEVVGQDDVVATLSQTFKTGHIAHAYLLTGTRGVGKTTLGRIIAKTVQCEAFPIAQPCGKCASCQAHKNNCHPDLYEIDAASKTKVEDTRQLLEHAHYAPNMGSKKVYLIDEVHMLSTHSFNALLKTLEEPPEHIMFILATTEIQRLPTTIVSRCLHLSLRALDNQTIDKMMRTILNHEKITFEDQAIAILSEQARGSMRDGLTLLEQISRRFHEGITTEQVSKWLGCVPKAMIDNITSAIQTSNPSALQSQLDLLQQQHLQPNVLLQQLIQYWHQSCLDAFSNADSVQIQNFIDHFDTTVHGIKQLQYVADPWIVVKMTLMRCIVSTVKIEAPKNFKKNNHTMETAENLSPHEIIASLSVGGMLKRALDGLSFKPSDPNTAYYKEENQTMYTDAICVKIKSILKTTALVITEFKPLDDAHSDNSLTLKKKQNRQAQHSSAVDKLAKKENVQDLLKSLDSALSDSIITDVKS